MAEKQFTHVDASGAARMVDVSGTDVSVREATATGAVLVSAEVVGLLRGTGVPKGAAPAVATATKSCKGFCWRSPGWMRCGALKTASSGARCAICQDRLPRSEATADFCSTSVSDR